jgi:hypothetical protein
MGNILVVYANTVLTCIELTPIRNMGSTEFT